MSYNFTVHECSGDEGKFPPVTVMLNGSTRSYTIINSSTTPVEEDSTYSILLTAVSGVVRSTTTSIIVTTTTARMSIVSVLLVDFNLLLFLLLAPSGPPQSIVAISATVSNITIEWEEVNCLQRNGNISIYTVTYSVLNHWGVTEEHQTTNSLRMFTAIGLWPRRCYNFTVRAVGYDSGNQSGPPILATNTTTVPQGM